MANDPLKQFETHPVVDFTVGGLDLSITNVTVFTALAALSVVGFLTLAARGAGVVPHRLQSVAELAYEFIANIIRDVIGSEGMKFFPFVFTLFLFILICNFLGMFPLFFTVTSQIAITLTLALATIGIVIIFGLYKHGLGFFKLFAPGGLPWWLYPIIVPIEVISFLSRPITLALRLFVNMFAGHVLLKLFAGFVVSLGSLGAVGLLGALLPMGGVLFVTALEFLVAFLQAYVFAVLAVIYLNDVVHMHH